MGVSYVDPAANVAVKTVSVTVLANAISGAAAHGMAGTPTPGRPNPNRFEGGGAFATADAVDVTVTLDNSQAVDIVFQVPLFLGLS